MNNWLVNCHYQTMHPYYPYEYYPYPPPPPPPPGYYPFHEQFPIIPYHQDIPKIEPEIFDEPVKLEEPQQKIQSVKVEQRNQSVNVKQEEISTKCKYFSDQPKPKGKKKKTKKGKIDPNLPYPKKNTESNIVNQIFSYACHEDRSARVLNQLFDGDAQKIKSFYQITQTIKKNKKKYINRRFLANMCILDENDVGFKQLERLIQKMKVLKLVEFQRVFAMLIMYYLRHESQTSVVSSKRISSYTWYEHLERRRQVKYFLIEQLKNTWPSFKVQRIPICKQENDYVQ